MEVVTIEIYNDSFAANLALEKLKAWLQHGPSLAKVSTVKYCPAELTIYREFSVINN